MYLADLCSWIPFCGNDCADMCRTLERKPLDPDSASAEGLTKFVQFTRTIRICCYSEVSVSEEKTYEMPRFTSPRRESITSAPLTRVPQPLSVSQEIEETPRVTKSRSESITSAPLTRVPQPLSESQEIEEATQVTKSRRESTTSMPQASSPLPKTLEDQVNKLFINHKELWIKEAVHLLPKCELHNHLIPDLDNNLKYAAEQKMVYDKARKIFITEPFLERSQRHSNDEYYRHGEQSISAQKMILDPKGQHYQEYFKTVTLAGNLKIKDAQNKIKDTQNHFFNSFNTILSTNMPLERQLLGEIDKLIADNIPYAEITIDFKQGIRPSLTNFSLDDLEAHLNAIQPWCEAYAKEWEVKLGEITGRLVEKMGWQYPWNSHKNPMTMGFLAEIMRTASHATVDVPDALATFFIDTAAALTLCQTNPQHIFGINVVGPEHNPIAKAHYRPQMEILDFLYKKLGNPNIALHAGEMTRDLSLGGDMKHALHLAVSKGHAKRIGHGLCIAESASPYALLEEMKKKNILIEVCLTSNEKIFGLELKNHPIKTYLEHGVNIALGTDDPHILDTTLSEEFLKAIKNYSLSYHQVKEWIRNSVEHAFLPGESLFDRSSGKYVVKELFKPLIAKSEDEYTESEKALFDSSWKARVQIVVEKKLQLSEKKILDIKRM